MSPCPGHARGLIHLCLQPNPKTLAQACKYYKHTVKRVCVTFANREANARTHSGLPAPQSNPGKAGWSRPAQGPREAEQDGPEQDRPREAGGARIWHIGLILINHTHPRANWPESGPVGFVRAILLVQIQASLLGWLGLTLKKISPYPKVTSNCLLPCAEYSTDACLFQQIIAPTIPLKTKTAYLHSLALSFLSSSSLNVVGSWNLNF